LLIEAERRLGRTSLAAAEEVLARAAAYSSPFVNMPF
jgi:hypothetical protein